MRFLKAIAGRLRELGLWLTGRSGVPFLARPTFRLEQIAVFLGCVGTAILVPEFCQLFARKGLGASPWLVAALAAGGAIGSLAGALASNYIARRRQPLAVAVCMYLSGGLLACVALLPRQWHSDLVFAAIILLVLTLNMISVNARTSIWRRNYPTESRAGIVSRNMIIGLMLGAIGVQAAGSLLDVWASAYRLLFPLAGLSWAAAGACYGRIRVRQEAGRLRREQSRPLALNPLTVLDVLREDKRFRRFMACQMLLGCSSLAVEPVVVLILTDRFGAGFALGALALATTPLAVKVLAVPLMARWFDRANIFRFRGFGALSWAAGRFVLVASVALLSAPLVLVSRALTAVGQSSGHIAWTMGHLHFADADDTHRYMGAHMILTGLRGLTMPFVGMWLYTHVLGVHLIWITALGHVAAAAGFLMSSGLAHSPESTEASSP